MRTFFFAPPLNKISGGLAVIYKLAEILHQAGREAALVTRETAPFKQPPSAPVLTWNELELTARDLWVVPEGWPGALAPGLTAGARNLVYVQNWAYLFSALPEGVSWNQLDVRFLSVSTPVSHFIRENTGATPELLRPGIDLTLFHPGPPKNGGMRPGSSPGPLKKINVAWMPRKNKAIVMQAIQILNARGRTRLPLNWVEIHSAPPAQVADLLRASHIFMGSGFPEGFGLPPLEAMACGAVPVTSAGFGGWDYLRQALPVIPELEHLPGLAPPGFYLRPGELGETDLPAGPNAFVVPDADPISLAIAVEHAANLIADGDPLVCELLKNGQATARALSCERQQTNVLELWDRLSL